MSHNSRRHGHKLEPASTYNIKGPSYVPEFKDPKKFAEKKIEILERDFKIKLTDKQKLHLKTLKTEREINAAVRQIINDAWR